MLAELHDHPACLVQLEAQDDDCLSADACVVAPCSLTGAQQLRHSARLRTSLLGEVTHLVSSRENSL